MEHIESKPKGLVWRSFAAIVLPFAVLSAYLFFSRWPSYRFTTFSDYAGLVASVLVGVAFVATMPVRTQVRALSLLIYVPVLCVLLFFYCLLFVGVVFGEWL